MTKDKVQIFASKGRGGLYHAEEIVKDLEKLIYGIEYGDAYEEESQIWEYPSGKIYVIKPDRKVSSDNYYSVPYSTKGVIWLPQLVFVGQDKEKIKLAYDSLTKSTAEQTRGYFISKLFKRQ